MKFNNVSLAFQLFEEARDLGLHQLSMRVFAWLFNNAPQSVSMAVEENNYDEGMRCSDKELEYGYVQYYISINSMAFMPVSDFSNSTVKKAIEWCNGYVVAMPDKTAMYNKQVGTLWTEEYYRFFLSLDVSDIYYMPKHTAKDTLVSREYSWMYPTVFVEVDSTKEVHTPKYIQHLGRGRMKSDGKGYIYRHKQFAIGTDYKFRGGYDSTCNRNTFFKRNYPYLVDDGLLYWHSDGTIGMIGLPYSEESVLGIRPSNIKEYYSTMASFFDGKDINTYDDEYMNIAEYKDGAWKPVFK